MVCGLSWSIALLFGALACVTGPTVIAPILRTAGPNARIANTLRWEGIVIDPLGALFAVLIYKDIVSRQQGHTVGIFLATIGCGVLIGVLAAAAIAFFLRRQMISEYLQKFAVLASVLLSFAVSNVLTHESELLAVTIMEIALSNARGVHLDDIPDFKENLTTVLVSVLFILLPARLHWPLPPGMLGVGLALFVIAKVLVRPVTVTVALACLGSGMSWRKRALIAWVAPRGIVVASVSAPTRRCRWFYPDHRHRRVAQCNGVAFCTLVGSGRTGAARGADIWLRYGGYDDWFGANGSGLSCDAGGRGWHGIHAARMEGLATF